MSRANTPATGVSVEIQAAAEDLVETIDEGMGVGRVARRGKLVGDRHVAGGNRREDHEEQHEQRQPGPDHPPEDAGLAEPVEPQGLDVEAGEGPAEDDDYDDEQGSGNEGDATRGTQPRAATRKFSGSPHRRNLPASQTITMAATGEASGWSGGRRGSSRSPPTVDGASERSERRE